MPSFDAIRVDVKAPNATTRKAIAELEAGKGKRFASAAALMADLNAGRRRGRLQPAAT